MKQSKQLNVIIMLTVLIQLACYAASAQTFQVLESGSFQKPYSEEKSAALNPGEEKPITKVDHFRPTSPDQKMNEYRYNLILQQYYLEEALSHPAVSEKEVAYHRQLIAEIEKQIELQKPQEERMMLIQTKYNQKMAGIESKNTSEVEKAQSTNTNKSVNPDEKILRKRIEYLREDLRLNGHLYSNEEKKYMEENIKSMQTQIDKPVK